ncbi:MAG TPA: hypothetical protein VEA63_04650 [Opitutus sp.]|nr:hypothetical protein [Opitutus sp.]
MGNYAIVIFGTGCHHNPDNTTDADKMAHQFVNKLAEAGHKIDATAFQVLTRGRAPEALREGVPVCDAFYRSEPPAEQAADSGNESSRSSNPPADDPAATNDEAKQAEQASA